MGNYLIRISNKRSKELTQQLLNKIVNATNINYITTKIEFTEKEIEQLNKHNLLDKTMNMTMLKLQTNMKRKGFQTVRIHKDVLYITWFESEYQILSLKKLIDKFDYDFDKKLENWTPN